MVQHLPIHKEVESKAVFRKTTSAHRALTALKGVVGSIPNENILLETLTLRGAGESSAIENIVIPQLKSARNIKSPAKLSFGPGTSRIRNKLVSKDSR